MAISVYRHSLQKAAALIVEPITPSVVPMPCPAAPGAAPAPVAIAASDTLSTPSPIKLITAPSAEITSDAATPLLFIILSAIEANDNCTAAMESGMPAGPGNAAATPVAEETNARAFCSFNPQL